MGLIDKSEYYLLHYGTNDEMQIFFQKDGLSKDLSKLISNKYRNYVKRLCDSFYVDKLIFHSFNENEILRYELECYLNV